MEGILVYITDNEVKTLEKINIREFDKKCFISLNNKSRLKQYYNLTEDGDFKIVIDPRIIPLHELKYHKDLIAFNSTCLIDVKYNCYDKKLLINKLGKMMLSNDLVLQAIFDRFSEDLSSQDRLYYAIGKANKNKDLVLSVLGNFLESRFRDDCSYLFLRELDSYLEKVIDDNKEKEVKVCL